MKYICFFMLLVVGNLPLLKAQNKQTFSIKYYCTNWGMNESWDDFCQKVKQAGYDGVETWLPGTTEEQVQMTTALEKHGLALGLLCGGGGADFDQYLRSYTNNLEAAANFKPDYINCHTGKDYYSFDQNKKLIEEGEQTSNRHQIPIYHETHRGRFSFAAHITREFLEKIPQLSLALDISHWCNVHESLLGDQKETVALALARTGHIHARVGHPQGPQVNDPAAPEWKATLEQHLAWWDEVVKLHKQQGKKQLTITTEFGPAGYLPTLPYTRQPVADQWQINVFMLNLLKARYAQL